MLKTGKSMSMFLLILLSALAIPAIALHAADKGGTVSGRIVDAETGEAVIGAAVQVEGTTIGNTSDIDGNFIIRNIPIGKQTLIVQCIGYAKTRIEQLEIVKGKSVKLNLSLTREVLDAGIVVEVTAEALQNNEASLLRERQLSNSVSDAISAEAISRSGSGDAASAVEKVTGVSVVGGKYVYVRGLGDRYVTTQLNGSMLPSADPDKQSFPMDMIPSALLDKIVVEKTFTPDKPANFAGGNVNIGTKELPGKRVLEFSSSFGYNSQVNLSNDYLTYSGGNPTSFWLGQDKNDRGLPDIVADTTVDIPFPPNIRKDTAQAMRLDTISKALAGEFQPSRQKAPLDQSYKLSYGDAFNLWDREVSVLASLSYKRSFSYYDGRTARWDRFGTGVNDMEPDIDLADSRAKDDLLWGGLFNLRLPISSRHKVVLNYMYTRNVEDESRYMIGEYNEALSPDNIFETRVLRYIDRRSGNFQASGEHKVLSVERSWQVDWKLSVGEVEQDEPNYRTFANDFFIFDRADGPDTSFDIQPNQYDRPTQIWRELDESNREVAVNLAIPFHQWSGEEAKFKVGSGFLRKERDFWERRFTIWRDKGEEYSGDPNAYTAEDNMGIKEITNDRYYYYNYPVEEEAAGVQYDSWQEVASAYAMVELPLSQQLQLITGARYERTLMQTASKDRDGNISQKDVASSVSLIYKLTDKTNLRASFAKTLARPSLREFAPYSSRSYAQGFYLVGNPELELSKIDNYDLRIEIFPRPNELGAISFFYRKFKNPIEQTMFSGNNYVQFRNVDEAHMYGAEFELRKNLDMLPGRLHNLHIGANLTLIHTQVDLTEAELRQRRIYDPDAPDTRPMQGQPTYVINGNLGYADPDLGFTGSLIFNVLGKKLAGVSLDGTPDLYEMPRPELDLVTKKELGWGIKGSISVKNILNSETREIHTVDADGESQEYIVTSYKSGVSWSIGLSWSL